MSVSKSSSAQARFDHASRALALRLEGRPAQVVCVEIVTPWLVAAEEAAAGLSAAFEAGERSAAVPAQVATQRLAGWRPAVERAEAVIADATPTDMALANVLTRARLVLHRYARHFGGQHRSTRDLGRLAEARIALVSLTRQAQPLAAAAADPALQQEARALPRFIEFLVQEQGEISDNLAASGRLDQARALGAIAATLEEGWLSEVVPVHRLARRPALLKRYLQSLREVHDRMGAVRHANLPDAHERAMETVSAWMDAWQLEHEQTQAEQTQAGASTCHDALAGHAQAIWERISAEVEHGVEDATLDTLRARCDRLDEVITQLSEVGPASSDLETSIAAVMPLDEDLRDGLIWLGQRYDQLANPG